MEQLEILTARAEAITTRLLDLVDDILDTEAGLVDDAMETETFRHLYEMKWGPVSGFNYQLANENGNGGLAQ